MTISAKHDIIISEIEREATTMNDKQRAFQNFIAQVETNQLKQDLLSKVMYERENVSDRIFNLAQTAYERLERDTHMLDYLYYRYIESKYKFVN